LIDDPEVPDDPAFGDLNVLRAVAAFPARRRNALLPWRTALDALAGND
jgi:NifU-like protein involved in Fe-S cluster formation